MKIPINYSCLTRFFCMFFIAAFAAISNANSHFEIGNSFKLNEITDGADFVVDSLVPQDKDIFLISKHGTSKEVLVYQAGYNEEPILLSKQRMEPIAPFLMEDRDFILAVQRRNAAGVGEIFRLNLNNYAFSALTTNFSHSIETAATTKNSLFLSTIDFRFDPDLRINTPRLKLFRILKNGLVERTGKAIGLARIDQRLLRLPLGAILKSQVHRAGAVTALSMSPLGRAKRPSSSAGRRINLAANRVLALGLTLGGQNKLHLWYFPDIERDFSNYQGHMVQDFGRASIENITFSPNSFGLLAVTNRTAGKIWVMRFDLLNKHLMALHDLDIEKPLRRQSTYIQLGFGPHDEIVAGINQSLYLFERNSEGRFERTDVSPVKDFAADEMFSGLHVKPDGSFVVIGTSGQVQFGKITH